MGNNDSFASAIASEGTNKIVEIDGGFFSFAFGNEIALCVDDKYFILNCDDLLWKDVKRKVEKVKDRDKLVKYWKKKSKDYEISLWSGDFDDLK